MCLIIYHKDIKNVSFPSCSLATTSLPHPVLFYLLLVSLCECGGKRVRGHLFRIGFRLLLCWGRGSLVSAVWYITPWDVLHRVVYSRPVNFRWLPWSHLPSPLRSSGITEVHYQKLYTDSSGQTQVIRPVQRALPSVNHLITLICFFFFLRHRSLYPDLVLAT